MAKPSLFKHWKFSNFVATLDIPRPYALGLLEFMWDHCYESGDPFLGTVKAIKITCDWDGEADELVSALLESEFIDDLGDGKYQVHDLHENAPSYVKDRWRKREIYRKESEKPLDKSKKTLEEKRENTPSLSPPLPNPTPKEKENICSPESDELFETFWKEYPRKPKGDKKHIKGLFQFHDPEKRSKPRDIDEQKQMVEAVRVYADYWEETKTENHFRMMPQGFINQGYWKPEQLPETRKTKYKDQSQERDPNWVNPFL